MASQSIEVNILECCLQKETVVWHHLVFFKGFSAATRIFLFFVCVYMGRLRKSHCYFIYIILAAQQ